MANDETPTSAIEVTDAERQDVVDGLILLRKQYEVRYSSIKDMGSTEAILVAHRINDLAAFTGRVMGVSPQG